MGVSFPKTPLTLAARGVSHAPECACRAVPPRLRARSGSTPTARARRCWPAKAGRMAITDITAPTAARKGPPCTVCAKLSDLDESEASALRSLLADPAWRYTELSDRLLEEGHDLAASVLARHARGGCSARERLR